MPAAIVEKLRRLVSNRILMAQFESDLLEDVVHFGGAAGKESFASRDTRQFVQNALAFHTQAATGIVAAQNPNAIKSHIGFLQQPSQFVKGVPGIVVLAVADQKQSTFGMSSSLHFFDAEITGVVKRGIVFSFAQR